MRPRRDGLYCTAAWTSFGGWGADFRKRFVRPYFRRKRAEEVQGGGSGFEAIAEKRLLFDKASIVMARANAAMIHTATLAP